MQCLLSLLPCSLERRAAARSQLCMPCAPACRAWLTHLVETLLRQLCLLGLYPRLAVCWGGDATDLELEASIVVGSDADL